MVHPKKLLEAYNLDARRSLGQNFLFDDQLLEKIVAAADITSTDKVLEIGPGVGALTHHLAQSAGEVVAVELDDRLLPLLNSELAQYENVHLIQGDVLEQDPTGWFQGGSYKVVANVPYYITGAILRHLLQGQGKPELMVLTVQKEVAERITAEPGDMSLLAVSVRFFGEAEIVSIIKAGAFWPRPNVDSAILRIDLGQGPLLPIEEEKKFFQIVKAGFSQKRKQLQKNLRRLGYSRKQIMALLAQAGIDGRRRAETLTIAEWLSLYKVLSLTKR